MKHKLKISFLVIAAAILAFVLFTILTERVMPWNKSNAIATTLDWGGLAPLPENSTDIEVKVKGGMFTREFVVSFQAEKSEINYWINQSKRLKELKPQIESNEILKYSIRPGENGAIGGTAIINSYSKVIIDMSWS